MAYNPNNPNGQATMANSAPVVIASNQSAISVTGTFYQATQPVSGTLTVNQLPVTSGGVTASTGASTGGASAITISASAGQVYGWYFYNANAVAAYIFFYDTASAITVGTTSPSYVLVVPATGGANVFGIGIPHSTSIKIGISQGRAVSTAMSSAVDYNVFYK